MPLGRNCKPLVPFVRGSMSDVSDLQDEIHALELSLSQIQREKHEIEQALSSQKDIVATYEKRIALLETQVAESHSMNTELQSDLDKLRASLTMETKQYEDASSQTEGPRIESPTVPLPPIEIPDESSPYTLEDKIEHESLEEAGTPELEEKGDILRLLQEENAILKQKIQLEQDVSYVKSRRLSLLNGHSVVL